MSVSDNQPVVRSFFRGWSGNDEIETAITTVKTELDSRTIIFVDIESAGNYCDIGNLIVMND